MAKVTPAEASAWGLMALPLIRLIAKQRETCDGYDKIGDNELNGLSAATGRFFLHHHVYLMPLYPTVRT